MTKSILLLCLAICIGMSLRAQSPPQVTINKAELGKTLTISYVIKNAAGTPIYVYAPFLAKPFDGIFDRKHVQETIWLTFPPRFKGNYTSDLQVIEVGGGSTFAGRLVYPFGAQQIANCTGAPQVTIKLMVGWARYPLEAQTRPEKDADDAISMVKPWQSIASSGPFLLKRSGPLNAQKCPLHQDVEIWR